MQEDSISQRVWMKFYSQNSTRRLGWAFRASSKLLFFSTRTSSSSAISARLATTSVQRSRNFIIVAEGVDSGITGKLVWVFKSFPLVKVWESSWYFVSTATNVAQARRKQKGSAEVRMRIYQAESSSCWNVTGPQQPAPGSEWLLMGPHTSADGLITPRSAALQAVNYLCTNKASVLRPFWAHACFTAVFQSYFC